MHRRRYFPILAATIILCLFASFTGGCSDCEDCECLQADEDGESEDTSSDGDASDGDENPADGDGNDTSDGDDETEIILNHPEAGQVIFTEIMYDPLALDDDFGEWLEIENISDTGFDLGGCEFRDGNPVHSTVIEGELPIAAGEKMVFGIVRNMVFPNDVELDWSWVGFNLSNSEDSVRLDCGENLIDEASYAEALMPYEAVKGASLSLCPSKKTAQQNDDLANWRYSTGLMPNGDFGSPRTDNESCN